MSDRLFVRDGCVAPELLSGLSDLSARAPSAGFGISLVTLDGASHRFVNARMPRPEIPDADFPQGRVLAAMENGDYFLKAEILIDDAEVDAVSMVETLNLASQAIDFLSEIEALAAAWLTAALPNETGAPALRHVV